VLSGRVIKKVQCSRHSIGRVGENVLVGWQSIGWVSGQNDGNTGKVIAVCQGFELGLEGRCDKRNWMWHASPRKGGQAWQDAAA
jgi:hypothetical protein